MRTARLIVVAALSALAACGSSSSISTVDGGGAADAKLGSTVDAKTVAVDAKPADAAANAVDAAPGAADAKPAVDGAPNAIDAAPTAIDAAPTAIDAAPTAIDAPPDVIDATPDVIDAAPDLIDASPPDASPPDAMVPTCGNGHLDNGETCDTAILAGPFACPTTCDDSMDCTTDTLVMGGTCQAHCTHVAITMPHNGDLCCPDGANANTDTDCQPKCGNGVIEGVEQCDDHNMMDGDGCSMMCKTELTAYRVTKFQLMDPHAFAPVLGCADVTGALNGIIQGDINDFSLSAVLVFRPRNQAASATTPMDLVLANCSASGCSTTSASVRFPAIAANGDGASTCLSTLPDTQADPPYTGAIDAPDGTCFATDAHDIAITISGIDIALSDARVGGDYSGVPATKITTGLLRGFMSEAAAAAIDVPFPIGDTFSLKEYLAGGGGMCDGGDGDHTDDEDLGPGNVAGWYFYINFEATEVPYTEN